MIRLAKMSDMKKLLDIYNAARAFMRKNGNFVQWMGKYPDEETLTDDIEKNQLYVLEDEKGVYACFALIEGIDPTYGRIDGRWLSNEPYVAIHRVAGDGRKNGVFKEISDFAKAKYSHLRVDTHEVNEIMKHVALKNGFQYVGVIYVADGTPRNAYEWVR